MGRVSSTMFRIAVVFLCLRTSVAMEVGVLSGHDPTAWKKNANCSSTKIDCNLRVYSAAIAKAAAMGVELIIFPEAYGLFPDPMFMPQFEPFIATVGSTPCHAGASAPSPQQVQLSCAAAKHKMHLATNVFVTYNGSNYIQDIVFGARGEVLASYAKFHLAPLMERFASPGPFAPTTVSMLGHRFGLIICFEGIYPYTSLGDWSQMDALKKDGADAFIWQVGSSVVPIQHFGAHMASKYGVPALISSAGHDGGQIVDGNGEIVHLENNALVVEHYSALASVRTVDMPFKTSAQAIVV